MPTEVKNDIFQLTNDVWTRRWAEDSRFKHTKQFYDGPDQNKSKGVMKKSTMSLNCWIQCITGHNNLAYFQSKLDIEINSTCRLCRESQETMYHLLTECPATQKLQRDIFQNRIPLPDRTWSKKTHKLLQTPNNLPTNKTKHSAYM